MTGVDGVITLQPAETAQGGEHLRRVAAGQIGASEGAGKKRIADKERVADFERNAAGRGRGCA